MTVNKKWLDKRTFGLCDTETKEIWLNLDLLIVDTYLHEQIHLEYPSAAENWVIQETARRLKRMKVETIEMLAWELLQQLLPAYAKLEGGLN